MQSKYIYGPVPSRRLGFSLGIDLIPNKNCSFDCIYCQLGRTRNKTIERKEYLPTEEILQGIKDVLKREKNIDYLTFSGSGEPTLHSKIGDLINEVKKITKIPVAVLTNGSLLFIPDVQKQIAGADVVLPTLCTSNQETLKRINRPHSSLRIEKIIQGQISFRKMYQGKIWLEVMLVRGINDVPEEIEKLKAVIEKIAPDKIHLNTVVRPPSEKSAAALSNDELQKIKDFFGKKCAVIAEFKKKGRRSEIADKEAEILSLIKRRPVTLDDIAKSTGLHKNEVVKYLEHLRVQRKIKLAEYEGKNYYEASE
jgi:wyosine [tRNA(Phe)-imidazoG37] synthetase (radical SAM superfamily)